MLCESCDPAQVSVDTDLARPPVEAPGSSTQIIGASQGEDVECIYEEVECQRCAATILESDLNCAACGCPRPFGAEDRRHAGELARESASAGSDAPRQNPAPTLEAPHRSATPGVTLKEVTDDGYCPRCWSAMAKVATTCNCCGWKPLAAAPVRKCRTRRGRAVSQPPPARHETCHDDTSRAQPSSGTEAMQSQASEAVHVEALRSQFMGLPRHGGTLAPPPWCQAVAIQHSADEQGQVVQLHPRRNDESNANLTRSQTARIEANRRAALAKRAERAASVVRSIEIGDSGTQSRAVVPDGEAGIAPAAMPASSQCAPSSAQLRMLALRARIAAKEGRG